MDIVLTSYSLLIDPDPGLQEQAFHIVRHLADTEEDIDEIFKEFGEDKLLGFLAPALETDSTDVLLQVCEVASSESRN
jgi:hypothetical protein